MPHNKLTTKINNTHWTKILRQMYVKKVANPGSPSSLEIWRWAVIERFDFRVRKWAFNSPCSLGLWSAAILFGNATCAKLQITLEFRIFSTKFLVQNNVQKLGNLLKNVLNGKYNSFLPAFGVQMLCIDRGDKMLNFRNPLVLFWDHWTSARKLESQASQASSRCDKKRATFIKES